MDGVDLILRAPRRMGVEAHLGGADVLQEGAPQSHIQDLESAADSQHRLSGGQIGGGQRQLRCVPLGIDLTAGPVFLPKAAGVDISAAAQQETVILGTVGGAVGGVRDSSGGKDCGLVVLRAGRGGRDQNMNFHHTPQNRY